MTVSLVSCLLGSRASGTAHASVPVTVPHPLHTSVEAAWPGGGREGQEDGDMLLYVCTWYLSISFCRPAVIGVTFPPDLSLSPHVTKNSSNWYDRPLERRGQHIIHSHHYWYQMVYIHEMNIVYTVSTSVC